MIITTFLSENSTFVLVESTTAAAMAQAASAVLFRNGTFWVRLAAYHTPMRGAVMPFRVWAANSWGHTSRVRKILSVVTVANDTDGL